MALKIYNDLTHSSQEFEALNPQKIRMYVCGITPYDETHLGHARVYVVFDVVRRYFEYLGYEVDYVQNFTDIDDKIIKKSESLNPKSENKTIQEKCKEITERHIDSYFDIMDILNVKRATVYPKATEHIQEMIDWIKGLIKKGYAYVVDNDVYFEVSKFEDYGKLSKRKLKDMKAGVRVEIDARKKDPLDFALWKGAKEGEPSWTSPWGKGRPGWHIECSVMSTKYLGDQFDIHGGGLDLTFPHHENEIAQTEALTNKKPYVKYWMHNGFVNINQQKMSKSLGNFFSMKDILNKYDPMVIRLFLLMTHYRSPINFSDEQLNETKSAYEKIIKTVAGLDFLINKVREPEDELEVAETEDELAIFKNKFIAAMDDDFNTAQAIGTAFEFIHFINGHIKKDKIDTESLKKYKNLLFEFFNTLGILLINKTFQDPDVEDIEILINQRNEARKMKNFALADEIRNMLSARGIVIEDTSYGSKWTKGS
ncbi:cysteine--tRNA ligase [candidate division WOR-1 bacterium RIFOXYA2_FULL_36_21]|uniref:Cysteine--tRNA ligase n=1 Tax=candidate division WOR-1 bacterium RIFOXYB2_FULL_36_35 TaxID=1802578 RepID=A0A1F4RYA4_UNCSA|nr:MAG: cysteine--tRNA ligase [candidate division WOR-1 bacterium RIFOXYA2_FULL_36_21]OGC13151.1 MAG: cysteine--tRNA ligase [candidate division WOR-1 bacterium RIFOXYB2_FULL_36_35]OGC16923.1 MAG: cysteine--tRNA ligase [candidate division WOR-1 bacterium RIFOXYA12_FULL_36_13]